MGANPVIANSNHQTTNPKSSIFMNTSLYRLIPRRLTSSLMYRLSRIEMPWLKNTIIRHYMRLTGANTSFALEKNPYAYQSLNAFFTRALAEGERPIDASPDHIASPVDGRCAIWQTLEQKSLLQAKSIRYTVDELLGEHELADYYRNGETATLYLAPDDYHRIHMPCDGELVGMRFCPGDKHSVALGLLDKIPNIFAGNERVVAWFETEFGTMTLVLVGALNVSSIETVWHGVVHHNPQGNTYHYTGQSRRFGKGEEIARFNLGSTVILFFPQGRIAWDAATLADQKKILMGQKIAKRC